MRVLRLLFISITLILLLFSHTGFSQSSIYKDAKELANHLEEDWSIYVELQKTDTSNTTLIVKDGETNLSPVAENKFVISSFGGFEVEVENYNRVDSVIISTKDSVLIISPSYDRLSIYNTPDNFSVQMVNRYHEDNPTDSGANSVIEQYFDTTYHIFDVIDTLTGETISSEKTMKIDTLYNISMTVTKIGAAVFYNIVPKNIQEVKKSSDILFYLSAHSDYNHLDQTTNHTFQKIQSQYATNPFLNNLGIIHPLLTPNVDSYFRDDFFEKFNDDFSQKYYQEYPWHKLLYGDSILNFQKSVSFKDASVSYRKQITTSQNELTDASIRINETNKRKNLLDAKTVAVGLSDFIAERAQEELNLTFFNRFKENLENESELTVLFPNTKTLLYQFEISNYKTLLSHARESFKVDLDNLGLNFPEVLKLEKYKKLYNSPEVFNLSLIYSIADLAYKEEPVENILVSAFQKLQERKNELSKNINIELADNFIKSVTPKNASRKNVTSKQVQKNTELQHLNNYVNEYLEALENVKSLLTENHSDFAEKPNYGSLMDNYFLSPNKRKELKELQTKHFQKEDSYEYSFFKPFIYNNRQIQNESIFDFYKNTINSNLKGKEFYGYLLNDPRPEDYQIVFKPLPDSINSILAKGIEGSRSMLNENFDEAVHQNFIFLEKSSQVIRKVTKDYILHLEKLAGPEKKILKFVDQVDLLKTAIDQEIFFWKKTTEQDETDHHIAGLYFLKNLLEYDVSINLFTQVASTPGFENNYEKIARDYYPITLEKNYQKNMKLASEQLDEVQKDFNDKIETLISQYGNINLNDSLYQHQLLNIQLHVDTLAFNRKIKHIRKSIKDKKIFLASASPLGPGGFRKFINDPILTQRAKEIKADYDKAWDLSMQLDELNKSLETITDAAEKENINNQINQLNDERDRLEEKAEITYDEEQKKLKNLEKEELKKMAPEKEATLAKYQENANNIKGSNISKPLKDIYSLSHNSFLENYNRNKSLFNEVNFENHDEMTVVNQLDAALAMTKNKIDTLNTKRQQLENYFTHLDTFYCKNLVNAQTNARNLSKSIEFSTHLLFAFRDYERIYDTVFVHDSTYLKITVNQLDTLTKYTNTITRDSLVIRKKAVKGFTDPLVAARWITKKEFEALRKNKTQWNIFLGLLYQRLRTIEDAPNFSAEGIALLATKFLGITNDMEIYRSDLRRKKAKTPELITFKDYYPFIRSTVDLFNTVITTPSLGDTTATVSKKFALQNIPLISNEALSLYENIYVKEYGNAVLNSMELLKLISNKKLGKKEARKSQRSINAVLTYGTFMANMINAQSSDQVKNILKSATLPPGSSRIKRETVSSFTINSYLGAAVGRDRLLGVPDNLDLKQDAFGASLSVPIGFTYSFSPNIIKNNSSFSIHVPLIDLGAITAYRQNPDNPNYSIDDLPDFSWQNLFSPGAFVVYNFANSPFSLGVGGQYGPQLRQITPTGGEAINVNSWRFPMAFFTIDVPFFNLHTGARKIIVD